MTEDFLIRLFGPAALLVHGDTLVMDRWRWLSKRMPPAAGGPRPSVLDLGCGNGAFSTGLSKRGYEVLGLDFNEGGIAKAARRAALCGAGASFRAVDIRKLDRESGLAGRFDVVVCFENIEHILDDAKLMRDAAACLKPGGRLLLTTPNSDFIPITASDNGPFPAVETGWHVRKGYTEAELRKLCDGAGLVPERFSYCSGFLSQKITFLQRMIGGRAGSLAVMPLRLLPPAFDGLISKITRWPDYSICVEARKLRP